MKILDIGANNGEMAKAFCKENQNFVVAVEPNPIHKPNLDGLSIVWETKAVSHTDNLILDMHVAKQGCSQLNSINPLWLKQGRFHSFGTEETFSVHTITIDSLVAKYGGFDHIKLDVEGYEDQAIKGMTHKYCPIQFEWVCEWFEITETVLNHLLSLGYDKFNCGNWDQINVETLPQEYLSYDELMATLKSNSLSQGMILAR